MLRCPASGVLAVPSVSAVISTFQRPAACERAVVSALEQDPAPLEVLVCDDGSQDDTAERFRAWESRDPRVRYLRVEPNRGSPSETRNLGTGRARGDLIAYLDDDDAWLPGKLRRQLDRAERADVIAGNAVRDDGTIYFPAAPPIWKPTRGDVIAENPVVMSTAMAPRALVMGAGGFLPDHWARGIEDYALWLQLADRGARFEILGEPLARYESHQLDRFSAAPARQQLAVARVAWQRLRERPRDRLLWASALRRTKVGLEFAIAERRGRLSATRDEASAQLP